MKSVRTPMYKKVAVKCTVASSQKFAIYELRMGVLMKKGLFGVRAYSLGKA